MNLVSVLVEQAAKLPDAPALTHGDRTLTFAEIEALAAAAGGNLVRAGVEPGDRVAIVAGNDEHFVALYLGTLWAGAIAVPVNPQAPAAELERELAVVEPALVVLGPGHEDLAQLAGGAQVVPAEALPVGPALEAEVERDDDEVAVLLFTSGTAGAPRAAQLTHGNLAANIAQVLEHPGLQVGPGDVGLLALPCFHIFGLNTGLGVALAAGVHTVLLDRFDPGAAIALIREHRVTVFAGVPTMFTSFLELPPDVAPPDAFATVRLAVSGAAAFPEEQAEAFRARFGVVVHEGYGLTEAAPIVSTTAVGDEVRSGSIGPPLPGVEVRLVGTDGEDAPAGDPGEIWVRGPNVFPGYWRDPEATARVLDDDGWLHTGDVAVADDDGWLHLVDRSKDLVIVSGFNVFPAEVEEVLVDHPDVADAAVLGVPSARTGEAVAAWVVLEAGAQVDVSALREHAQRFLARYKVPSVIEVVERLPRNEAGKLLRRELRATVDRTG